MRKLIIPLVLCSALSANAQSGNNQKPQTGKYTTSPVVNTSPNSLNDVRPASFEEYLVQTAWQNSFELEGSKYEIEARGQEIQLAKKEWTRNLQAGVNMNEVSFPYFLVNTLHQKYWFGKEIDLTHVPSVATYPLWNIGAGVNIGDLINRKHKVKFAEDKRKISEADMNSKKQKLRGEVLKRYQEYQSSFDIYKVRIQALDAAESNKNQMQSLFSVNKAQFEDYNTANKAYYDALENKVRGEAEIKLKRVSLEELLGQKWDIVERVKSSYEDKKKN